MSRPIGDDSRLWSAVGRTAAPPATAAPESGRVVAGDESGFGVPTLHGAGVGNPIRARSADAPASPKRLLDQPRSGASELLAPHDPPSAPIDPGRGRARAVYTPPGQSIDRPAPSVPVGETGRPRRQRERGLPGWSALLVFLGICGVGGLFDVINGSSVRGAFNVAIVVAAIAAILLVRRDSMFTIVIAPPLVYLGASAAMLFARGGLSNKQAIYDEATNWLVYGFPAIAGATAAVLLIAGARLIINR